MRARNIKPGFFKNEELAELGFFERLLFIGLWCLADREGRLEDRPKRIKMELFPCDNCDVEDGLKALESAGFIVRYVYEKYSVIEVCKFKTHQSPHGTERDSELPDHNGMVTVNERKGNAVVSGRERLVNVNSKLENALNPDSLIPDLPNPDCLKPEVKPAKPSPTTKGTRLPIDWSLPTEWATWAIADKPGYPVILEAAKFKDYWLAKTGKDATKADWFATWRNWVRNTKAPFGQQPTKHNGFDAVDYRKGVGDDGSF